ncbi:MAG: hypothetical protein IJQ57_00830 [Synergistaceae bacterium]|nr:hypothetical protein [Synergistaceae bacterium]
MTRKEYVINTGSISYPDDVRDNVEEALWLFETETDNSNTIDDLIHAFTDQNVPIYYSELYDAVRVLDYYCTQVVSEGLYCVDSKNEFSLTSLLQSAYYELIREEICNNLETILFNHCTRIFDRFLKENDGIEVTPAIEDTLTEVFETLALEYNENTDKEYSALDEECKEAIKSIFKEKEGEGE